MKYNKFVNEKKNNSEAYIPSTEVKIRIFMTAEEER